VQAGIYTYPWDLADEGHDLALGRIADAGLTAVNLACAYHAGKFLLPHNPRRRVAFAEDGALYFRPDPARYGRILPRVSSLVTVDDDPLAALDRERRKHGLDLAAWVVCLHNTWIGERYPECTLHNAFGDPYLHSLCPADPDVRAYVTAVLTDIVTRAEITAVELEAPGYLGFVHGFHHEIIGVPLDDVQRTLLGLSFHSSELELARVAGIDGDGLRRRVADTLTRIWEDDRPPGDDIAGRDYVRQLLDDPEFDAYAGLRETIVREFVGELRDAVHQANPAVEVRLFDPLGRRESDGQLYGGLETLADGALAGYATSDDDARERAGRLRTLMGERPVYGMVRALHPDTLDPAEIAPRVSAWRASGVDGIDFYNYGLMTLPMLRAIGAALADT
jgi:hypothetical protein